MIMMLTVGDCCNWGSLLVILLTKSAHHVYTIEVLIAFIETTYTQLYYVWQLVLTELYCTTILCCCTYFKCYLFLTYTDDTAAIQMVMATMNVAENVAGGSVQVCAEIIGVTGMLECSVSTTATIMGSTKASKKL